MAIAAPEQRRPVIPAHVVLDAHAQLVDQLRHPSHELTRFFAFFMADAAKKDADRAHGMFYPARQDRGEAGAHLLSTLIGKELAEARTFQVTAGMAGAVSGVYRETARNTDHLSESELPCAAGFAWFDEPWIVQDVNARPVPVRALSWAFLFAATTPEGARTLRPERLVAGEDGRSALMPCVRICAWTAAADDAAHGRVTPEVAAMMRRTVGELSVLHTAVIPFGAVFNHEPGQGQADGILGVTHVLWMFLDMEITSTTPVRPPRAFCRRALRTVKHGEVNVIRLRRITHPPDESGAERKIDWSCQWVVQGHYRHLGSYEGSAAHHRAVAVGAGKHCIVCGVECAWVRPFIKGPEGRPFKVSKGTVWRLER